MQECKYYVGDQTLGEYCLEHGFNVDSVRTRIWKKRNNPKFAQMTDQEIVNMVIAKCGTGVKYMRGDMSLRQYCILHDLNFGTICSRIASLKKQNPTLTNDELVTKAVDEFENQNYTLFYHGVPLKEWCSKNPDVNYNTLRGHILTVREKFPDKTVDEIVDEYLKKEHFGIYRYYYCGIPLRQYCDEKNISYTAVVARIQRYQKKHDVSSDDELVNLIMDKYEPFSPKYMYGGVSLSSYCHNNDISYYSVVSYVKRKLEKNRNSDVDSLIAEAIKTIKKQGIIYYYEGIPLIDYAREHNLNASSIRASIIKKRAKSDLPLQEIVNRCVLAYQGAVVKYYYEDETLFSYCKKNRINYNTVISRYLDMEIEEEDEERKKTIKAIVDDIRNNPVRRTKYYFLEQSLRQYCISSSYSYSAIYRRVKKLESEFSYALEQEVVHEAVLTYEEKTIIKKNNGYFTALEEVDEVDLDKVCGILKVDYDSLVDMINMGFNVKQAVVLIWFLCPNKAMNDNILRNIYVYIEMEKRGEYLDIYVLYVLYKTCIVDTSRAILLYFESFLREIIAKYREYYRELSQDESEELWMELSSYMLVLINYIYLDDRDKFLKHIMYLLGEKVRSFYDRVTFGDKGRKLSKSGC